MTRDALDRRWREQIVDQPSLTQDMHGNSAGKTSKAAFDRPVLWERSHKTGETLEPCGTPRRVSRHSPSSMTPAPSHLEIRRSPIRCSTNSMSQPRSNWSKKARMSASAIQLTLRRSIPYASASSASCAPRPGRNPWLNPRNSGSNIGVRMVSATAVRTILSSSAAMPSGRVPPSGFGISTRRDGSARYAPL